MQFGQGRGQDGVVLMTTLGTGIGSALFNDGKLVPNTELGHITLNGMAAEKYAASSIFKKEGLSWQEWAERLQEYYTLLELLFSPDLFIVGGGVSKDAANFLPLLSLNTPIVAADLRNQAGIVGAAVLAKSEKKSMDKKQLKKHRKQSK